MAKLSHTDESGRANMVNVADKPVQQRIARAEGYISMNPDTVKLVTENQSKKGDVLAAASIAGISAAKQTQFLIPLCHSLQLDKAGVEFEIGKDGIKARSEIWCTGRTGVEMEALTAVSLALLTIYDMCKAVDKNMVISDIRLTEKIKK
jgi:cyclic pyranopterin phosphate synthase